MSKTLAFAGAHPVVSVLAIWAVAGVIHHAIQALANRAMTTASK